MAGFFDKMVVGLNKGVNAVSEGSKYILEKSQINIQLQNVEKEKNSLATNIGNIVYDLYASGEIEIPQCEELLNNITTLNKKKNELNNQLKVIEEQMAHNAQSSNVPINGIKCSCGNINKQGTKFCTNCGKPIENTVNETTDVIQDGIKCSCGFVNTSDTKFCVQCGQKLDELRSEGDVL
jgi:seryl-tRNA synthetase